MPPSAPTIVYTPPSPGSPPAAAGAVYEPAPAGKAVLTISSVTTEAINGQVRYCGLIKSNPAWSTDGTQTAGASNTIVEHTGTAWKVARGSSYSATKTSAADTPDGLTSWTVGTGDGSPTIAASAAPTPPAITA